jgi:tRNA (guanine37-N1)-methyltransferase
VQLSQVLKEDIPEDLHHLIPDRFEVIGDIAILSIPNELLPYQTTIAKSLINQRRNITTVLGRVSKRSGTCRIAGYQPIIGTKTRTLCKESGFRYRVDLSHAFFTSRLAGERQRISEIIRPGELILVPFAGVGPFVIPVAARGARVIAIEMNPDACLLLRENIRQNHLEDRVDIIRGDASLASRMLRIISDRVIIPTPYGHDETFVPLSRTVRKGGSIHFYTFDNRDGAQERAKAFTQAGYEVDRFHRCGNVAPSVSRWVYDLTVR